MKLSQKLLRIFIVIITIAHLLLSLIISLLISAVRFSATFAHVFAVVWFSHCLLSHDTSFAQLRQSALHFASAQCNADCLIVARKPCHYTARQRSCGAVYCNRLCLFLFVCVCVSLWVCYHDNSKLHAPILTKLGLQVKVVTISSWLKFGHPAPPERGLRRGEIFGSALLQPARSVCVSFERFFHYSLVIAT